MLDAELRARGVSAGGGGRGGGGGKGPEERMGEGGDVVVLGGALRWGGVRVILGGGNFGTFTATCIAWPNGWGEGGSRGGRE